MRRRRSRFKRGCVVRRRIFRRVPVRRVIRALLAASLLLAAFFGTRARASGQTAGTANLLSTPAGWPSTGASSGFTGVALDPLAIYMNPAGLAAQDERSLLVPSRHAAVLDHLGPGRGLLSRAGLGGVGLDSRGSGREGSKATTPRIAPPARSTIERPPRPRVSRAACGVRSGEGSRSRSWASRSGRFRFAPALDLGFPLSSFGASRRADRGLRAERDGRLAGSRGSSPSLDRSYRLGLGARVAAEPAYDGTPRARPRHARQGRDEAAPGRRVLARRAGIPARRVLERRLHQWRAGG